MTAITPDPDLGPPATRRSAYVAFTGRSVRRFLRRPDVVVGTFAFPVVLMLTMLAVFSSAVEAFEDGDYAQRLVPGLIVSGVLFGSLATATGFFEDLRSGFMDRVRSMPVASSAPLVGTVAAEALRALLAVATLVLVGSAFGFRFANGPIAAAGFVALAVVAAVTVIWVGVFMATVAKSQEAVGPPLNAVFLVLLFFSRGLVPLEAYPGWSQPLVRANPASAFVVALDNLARGGPLLWPILFALAWSVAIVAVFATLAIRRLAARSAR